MINKLAQIHCEKMTPAKRCVCTVCVNSVRVDTVTELLLSSASAVQCRHATPQLR